MLGYQKKESIYLKLEYLRGVFNLVCCVVGRLLFREARRCALTMGAEKLFISAIPSAETIAFYKTWGARMQTRLSNLLLTPRMTAP